MSKFGKYIIVSIIALGLIAGCGSNRKGLLDLVEDGKEYRLYEVYGMDCPGCHGGLENQINKLSGVIAAKANWEKQQLELVLTTSANITDEVIFEAIKKANFTPGKRIK